MCVCVWGGGGGASYKANEETPISKSCMFFCVCHCPAFHPDLCRAKGMACVTPLKKHFSHALFLFFIQLCGECALFTVPIQPPAGETYWWKAVSA